MEEESRNAKLLRELNNAVTQASIWGHAHTFMAGLIIGGVTGFLLKWWVF